MESQIPVNTDSLRLRCIVVEDAERMMKLNGEPTTSRWLPSHVYADLEHAISRMRYLNSCCAEPGDPRLAPYVLAVDHLASGALLRHVGFSPFDGDVEVSYAIAEAARGHGYGAEALRKACQWAAEKWRLPRLLALTEASNAASRRTLERAGFVHDEDAVMAFQGSLETVSRYVWRRLDGPDANRGPDYASLDWR